MLFLTVNTRVQNKIETLTMCAYHAILVRAKQWQMLLEDVFISNQSLCFEIVPAGFSLVIGVLKQCPFPNINEYILNSSDT